MIAYLRRRLRWKLFLSYLAVVFVGGIVLIVAMEFAIPRAFSRHLATMGMSSSDHMMVDGAPASHMADDLFVQFRTAVTEATLIALTAATLIAVAVSAIISRRVIAPVREMMVASRQIAQGNYGRRVALPAHRPIADLDEMGQLADSFNQMAAQLEEADTVRRELIGDVTHELTTPLTVIKGSMEGLIDGVLPPETETFQQVAHEADRLQRLVADLQELSRVEAGAYELHSKPTDLAALIMDVNGRLRRQFDDKGVRLEENLPTGLLMADIDPDRISQVLINLVGNGLQYTPSGGRVEVLLQRDKGKVLIRVTDSGIGIGDEHLQHLFTRFYRVDKSRARASGGSGIGLTIARHVVEAHNGRLWVESEGINEGSTFSFTLPMVRELGFVKRA